ncbi:putative nucleotidyltransferase, ribonuclease H [Tanacetum coccineum]
MRQRRWLELLKDYDINIQYHPDKANVLMEVELVVRGSESYIASLKIEHNLILRIKEAQKKDEWTGNWDEYLCLVEFTYNNRWHASIKGAIFELLYGRKCRAPICWNEVEERVIEGPELVEVMNGKLALLKRSLRKLGHDKRIMLIVIEEP